MATRGVKWRIEQEGEEFDVRQGRTRRQIFHELDDAIEYVQHVMDDGDKVYLVEPDGYENRVSIRPRRR